MSRVFVALFATALALNFVAAQADEGNKNVVRDSPQDKATKRKAVEDAKPLPTTESWGVGDFPPFRGRTVDQWRQDEKRRKEQLQQAPPKSTAPKSTDEERAERTRLFYEWEKTQLPAPK